MDQPLIFISYSHKDEDLKNRLLAQLGILETAGLTSVWDDDRIGAGEDWEDKIAKAMRQARIAILLISANFLSSDFISGQEVPELLRRRRAEGLTIFPVIAKACAWWRVEWLAKLNVRPKNGLPVWGDGGTHIDEDLADIADEVAGILEKENLHPDSSVLRAPRSEFQLKTDTILIPAGRFVMAEATGTESNLTWTHHEFYLPDYEIGRYPVTNQEYAEFVKDEPRRYPRNADWNQTIPPAAKLKHPVVGVSWDDTQAYCRWLSQRTGQIYRLPTEAEWEKAARGGLDSRIYPWGDQFKADLCNNNRIMTTPVDQYSQGQSPYGCYDLVGNVREWTQTSWGDDWRITRYPYPYQQDERERVDLPQEYFRICRGGAYNDDIRLLGCSPRSFYAPQGRVKNLGFRIVREF
jgi:formylglycine-generating enzyme required for sulfatase activity